MCDGIKMTVFLLFSICLPVTAEAAGAERPRIGKAPPPGVVELVGVGGIDHRLIERKDGSLMMVGGGSCRVSTDGGRTWGPAKPLGKGASGAGIVRLASGALALTKGAQLRISQDEGQTWGPALAVGMLGSPFWDTMIQLKSGRLLYPSRICRSSGQADLACAPKSLKRWPDPGESQSKPRRPESDAR